LIRAGNNKKLLRRREGGIGKGGIRGGENEKGEIKV
jgi:hypothetical protein